MKKFFMPLLLAAGMLMLTAAANPDYSTPESTVRTFERSIKNADADSAFQCYNEISKKSFPFAEFKNSFLLIQAPAANSLGNRYSFEITETLKNGTVAVVKTKQSLALSDKAHPCLKQLPSQYHSKPTAKKSREISKKLSEHFNGNVPSAVMEISYVLTKEKDGWKIMDDCAEMPEQTKKDWKELVRKNRNRGAKNVLHEFISLCTGGDGEIAYNYLSKEQKKTLSQEEFLRFSDNLLTKEAMGFGGRFPFEIAEIKENGDIAEITVKHTFIDGKAVAKDIPELQKRYPNARTEKEIYDSFHEFYKGKIPSVTETAVYRLVKENGEWKINLPESTLK